MYNLSHFKKFSWGDVTDSAAPFAVIISLDKMLETTVVFLLFFSHFGEAYNVDTTSPVKLTSNEEDGLFGLSVALSNDSVYVGAPNEDPYGNVYQCKCTKSGSCSSPCSVVSHGKTHTIRKVKFLSKNSILTKTQHFHEFFTKNFF